MRAQVPVGDRAIALLMSFLMAMTALMTFVPAQVSATQVSNCGVRPIDLVFVIDRSGSMNTSEGAHTRLGWAKLAAAGLVDQFNSPAGSVGTLHQIGVSTFGGTTTTRNVQLGASNAATVNAAINAIAATGGTPFDIGMAEGADNMLDGDRTTYGGVAVTQVLIFLSDGNPDPDSFAPSNPEIASYLASADKAYAVAIGPDGGNLGGGGTGVSYALMRQISKPAYVNDGNPGGFRAVTNGSGLPNLFDELYEEIACPTGKLEVIKNVEPDGPGQFDLWIGDALVKDEATDGQGTGEQSLNAGTYTFSETADGETSLANYTSSASCVNTAPEPDVAVTATQGQGASWSVNVPADSDIVCTITNTRKTGTLTVHKDVINDDGGSATCDAFSFSVNGGAAVGFDPTDCTNVLVLPTGTYSVTEPAAAGYETGYANCSQMAVTHDANVTCTITNDDIPGKLIVIKDLSTDNGAIASCDDFSFSVNGGVAIDFDADCNNEMTVDAGTYSVVETDADGFATTYSSCSQLAIANDGSATCTISNDDKPGTLIVNKIVSGGDLDCEDFTFTVNGGNPMSFERDCQNDITVDAGSYTVIETDADGYTTIYENCAQLAVANDGTATCTITNTRQTGTIEVEKNLEPSDDAGRFDLLINGSPEFDDAGDGDSTGAVTLETGSHTVGEAAGTDTVLGNYSSFIECRDDAGEGDVVASGAGAGPLAVEVTNEDEILCVITNMRVSVGIEKTNDAGDPATVEPGQVIGFTLTVTVSNGTATNVIVTDLLPDGLTYVADSASPSGAIVDGQSLRWELDSLAAGAHPFTYAAMVDADASGDLTNLGCVDADQNRGFTLFGLFGSDEEEEIPCSTTTVLVQDAEVTKTNGTTGPVAPGTDVDFTLTIGVTNGPIDELTIEDELPDGISVTDETTISDGGTYSALTNTITWHLVNVADGETLTYQATVGADALDGEYVNVATITDGPCVGDCDDDSSVTVLGPTLVIDKVASTDTITISGPNDALVASPAIVTWTLSYTLSNGPVSSVLISDEIPSGFTFLDASDGGTFADGTVSWAFATLTESGSVTFRTTVDPETISRVAPTVNVAVIDSDQTGEDEGNDSVSVSVEPPPQGGNPTPEPSLPDTAVGARPNGESVSVPLGLLVALFLGSLGALALANVRARSRGR